MERIRYKPTIDYRKFERINGLIQSEYYKPLFSYNMDINGDKQPEYIQGRSQVCAFCEAQKTNGFSFKKIAHVIPALFNNPRLYSCEECDNCNEKFGRLYESELGMMLNPYLIASQILPRKGTERKAKDLETRVEYKKEEGLDVKSQADFNIDTEKGQFELNIPYNKYRPQNALKSLIHTLWLILDKNDRNENPWIKDMVNDISREIPTHFYIGSIIPEKKEISLCIYKKIKDNDDLSEYMIKLKFGFYVMYYGVISHIISNQPTMKFSL